MKIGRKRVDFIKLTTIASGSSGNCYLLQNENEIIVIEAGVPFLEVKKLIDFEIDKIKCVLCSHAHLDHGKYLHEYMNAGIPVGTSKGTLEALNLPFRQYMSENKIYRYGEFKIIPFRVVHDCVEPFGFIIEHEEIGKMLFVTDTHYVKYDFSNLHLNHIMVECNYSEEIIKANTEKEVLNAGLKNRIMKSHMSLKTCKDFVINNSSYALENVILLHLSDRNSDERRFKAEIEEIVTENVNVFIADKGLAVDLDICPF